MRKTANIRDIVEDANKKLAGWTKTAEERQGIINMLEHILYNANAYAGFGYLTEDQLSKEAHLCAQYNMNETGTVIDTRPGVRSHIAPREQDGVDKWFENTDKTRVFFYVHPDLR